MNKLLTAILCTLAFTTAWATDETITFSELGYSNAQEITTVNGTNFTITFNKGTNSNAPKYYDNGSAIRVYGGGYFIVSSTKTLTKIELSFSSGEDSNTITTDVQTYSNGTWTGSAKSVKFTIGGTSGNRRIASVAVTYEAAPSIPTVTGIAAFKRVTAGTTVQLYLPDTYNARVTHVEASNGGTVDAYVRDDTGAMRMTGISPNRAMAYDQHLAGWITGKYTIGNDGIPQFEPADGLTNTDQLVIADRVTEEITKPKAIDAGAMGNNLANWVTISDLEVTGNNVDASKFNLAYQDQAYTGAIVDVTGIAANGKLYPVDDLNKAPITFVVDAEKSFTSPSASIENANVRLKRSLSSSQWNLLTVPFDIDVNDFDGEVMQYTGVELGKVGSYVYNGNTYDIQGGVMRFGYLNSGSVMQAGVPYLVKPGSSVRNGLTFNAVTLSNAPAGTITKTLTATAQATMGTGLMAQSSPVWAGDYSLVGSYSPVTLDKNEETVVFTGNNEISWTSLIDDVTAVEVGGTQGYITIPSGAGVALGLEDSSEPVITAITTVAMRHGMPAETVIYNLMGQRLTRPLGELPPGIYIVNGKKIVKR